ncbi:hypothetical protein D1816_11080 [Aquimarina sp. AD10]|uniref:Uncharacterized protein n=1 Tax=Aquimarina aggregata TaxID=1642818 RepID=A0A162ZX54_9FLAO|nr:MULTISPECIES: hypothetical protein [Aquimarina]AXT60865.1 hypothetical protein D1816_11080 [Aquimarina sp. AD10]KZS40101.1 hypothetical protein AWE51_25535 [Aquimarina aggregata]RKM98436.1 hypothetical protein D7033_12215 [Aquimarina sp. AD10]
MSILFITIGVVVGAIILGIGIVYLRYFIPLRPQENGFEYVHVNDDGTVRELYKDEVEYLNEEFHPTDGARPYIKSRYKSLTPDKRMSGFIQRNRVPKKVEIKNVVQQSIKK